MLTLLNMGAKALPAPITIERPARDPYPLHQSRAGQVVRVTMRVQHQPAISLRSFLRAGYDPYNTAHYLPLLVTPIRAKY